MQPGKQAVSKQMFSPLAECSESNINPIVALMLKQQIGAQHQRLRRRRHNIVVDENDADVDDGLQIIIIIIIIIFLMCVDSLQMGSMMNKQAYIREM